MKLVVFSFIISFLFIPEINAESCISEQVIRVDTTEKGYVPFQRNNDGRIIFTATFEQDTLQMLVDTYASYGSLPVDFYSGKTGFKKINGKHVTSDYMGRKKAASIYRAEKVEIGALVFKNKAFKQNEVLNEFHVGIIGSEILGVYNWHFPSEGGRAFYSKDPIRMTDADIVQRFSKGTFPYFNVQVANMERAFVLDMGGTKGLALSAKSEMGRWLIDSLKLKGATVVSGGANKNKVNDVQYYTTLPKVRIGGKLFSDVPVTISERSSVYFLGAAFWGKGDLILNYIPDADGLCSVAFRQKKQAGPAR